MVTISLKTVCPGGVGNGTPAWTLFSDFLWLPLVGGDSYIIQTWASSGYACALIKVNMCCVRVGLG